MLILTSHLHAVITTKFGADYRMHALGKGNAVNYGGISRVAMNLSLRDSLTKLRTDRIDIFFVHFWDYTSTIEEVMDALHVLIQQGKVMYLGVSNTPAWVVSAANTYARAHGKTPFVIYQGSWSLVQRDLERDVIPMARQFGMASKFSCGGAVERAGSLANTGIHSQPIRCSWRR